MAALFVGVAIYGTLNKQVIEQSHNRLAAAGVLTFFLVTLIATFWLFARAVDYQNAVELYGRKIQLFRQYLYVKNIIEYMRSYEIQRGLDLYNNCLKVPEYRKFVHGFIVCQLLHSIEFKWKVKGQENLNVIFNDLLSKCSPYV